MLRELVGLPMTLATSGTRAAVGTTRSAVTAVAGVALSGEPLSELTAMGRALAGVAREAVGGPRARRTSSHGSRRWVEVRGLESEDGEQIGDAVLSAIWATPGVDDAVLVAPISRVLVTIGDGGPSAARLSAVVAEAERRTGAAATTSAGISLPGDDEVLAARVAAVGVAAAAVGLTMVGGAVGLPRLAKAVSVPTTVVDHTPVLRRQIEERVGADATDMLFALANSATAALTASPASAVAEALGRAVLVTEAWTARRAWQEREPELARRPTSGGAARTSCTDLFRTAAPADRYASHAAAVGLGAAAVLGAATGSADLAAQAALIAVPKPLRAAREAFGATMTRGLDAHHGSLVMSSRGLRLLDRVDAIVIDPRALYTRGVTVSRVRGLENSHRASAWEAARIALARGELGVGWHPLSTVCPGEGIGEVLVSPVRDPHASALLAEARRTNLRVISVEDDGLHSLAEGFDQLQTARGSVDNAVADAVSALTSEGATVALVTTSEMNVSHSAHVTIGLMREDDSPPWGADVFVTDLTGAWRVLRALPAARRASDQAVRLSASASAIGALMLVPGVVGRGPASVSIGSAASLWSGITAANRVFRDPAPHPEPRHDWHCLPADEVCRLLPRPADDIPVNDPSGGPAAKDRTTWAAVREFVAEMRHDLDDPITPLLITGAAASALLGSAVDAVLVAGVLLANAAVSAEQQLHAEHVLNRLLAVQEPAARRRIGPLSVGRHDTVAADRLRPGDIIEVRGGEVVPADARLLDVSDVEVDESALTGESLPVSKSVGATPGAPLAERECMLFGGSTVLSGTALAVVTAVGPGTEMRRAMAMAPRKSSEIGLHTQLRHITHRALPVSVVGGALVGVLGGLRGLPLKHALASAVSVMVAAVPEGLPLVATLAQQAAAGRLSDKAVLVRNPHSVEAFARLDVVCFDKTGTLSENHLRVRSVHPMSGRSDSDVLTTAARTTFARAGHRAQHATDQAIREAVEGDRRQFDQDVDGRDAFLPFQSDRPFAAALKGKTIAVKGAPETLSAAVADGGGAFGGLVADMGERGLRVLAVAERHLSDEQAAAAAADTSSFESLCRSGLTPVGLIGLADTPRPAARGLLTELQRRHIGVRLITGDHPVTARAVASELGLLVSADEVITGIDWETMTPDQREAAAARCRVFARMSPEHKIDVVQALEKMGLVTAMVGDGANDAAAIRAASIGVGVVARGSDPARTAADVMLLDGRIEALLDAIDEGHQLWRRVHSAVSVLLGGNAGEVGFALITTLLTGDSALNTRQMLLVNLLTDAFPAAALAVSEQKNTSPGPHDEAALWKDIGIRGVATASGATLAWLIARPTGTARHASTVALVGLVGAQLLQTLIDSNSPGVVLTSVGSLAAMGVVISTPGISQLFGCTPLTPIGWAQGLLAASAATAVSALAPGVLTNIADRFRTADSVEQQTDSAQVEQDRQ